MRAAADAEAVIRRRQAELPVEAARQLVIVVLAGVDQDLVVARPQDRRQGRGLDQLRPRPNDTEDSHGQRLPAGAAWDPDSEVRHAGR